MKYYLNIGTNLGNRQKNIEKAIEMLDSALQARCRCSTIVESPPWGYASPNRFLNIGAVIDSELSSTRFLEVTQSIEQAISTASHRDSNGSYVDRIIDIDIIAIDRLVIDTPTLKIPHPRMHLRAFVLQPMAQLAPAWRHPILHLTAAEMLNGIKTS